MTAFIDWLARERNLHFDGYDALWRWSVNELDAFWGAVWDYARSPPWRRAAAPWPAPACRAPSGFRASN